MIWLQRVGRQRLADHRLDGLLGVTNFDISMAASLAGVALAELLLATCAHAVTMCPFAFTVDDSHIHTPSAHKSVSW